MTTGGWQAGRGGFRDREEAGRELAAMLAPVVTGPCVVAAIPRGGVAVALPVARRLAAPLTVVYARKLAAPFAPELAFGAMDEDGRVLLSRTTVEGLRLRAPDLEEAKARVEAEIRRRMALYRVPPLAQHLPGAAVVLVDDGLATGLTMRAALTYARRHGAREVTVAVPCASQEAAERFRREADRFVCPIVDEAFMAVGQYYEDFSPVTDEQVVAMLRSAVPEPVPAASRGTARVLSFRNSRGLRLAGALLLPEGAGPHPVVVFADGWGGGKDSPGNRAAAEALRTAGFAAFLFDFTGRGESEGTEGESTPVQQVDDLGAALDLMGAVGTIDTARIGVVGADSGGAVALLRAAIDQRIGALVLRSANLAGAEDAADRVTAPTLLVAGEADGPVRAASEALLAHLPEPRRLEIVPGGDHLLEEPAALRRAVALTVRWFEEHLKGASPGAVAATPARAEARTGVVRPRGAAGGSRSDGAAGAAPAEGAAGRDPAAAGAHGVLLLHPTDFSAGADRARAEAIRLARALGAEVLLVHVESPFYAEGLMGMTVAERVRAYEAQRRWAEEMLEARVADTRAAGVPARGSIRVGRPSEEIVRAAEAHGADLIVIGTYGRAGLERMFLGSVADQVIRTAPCPVVAVRERQDHAG